MSQVSSKSHDILSVDLLHLIYEQSPDAILIFDSKKNRIVSCNQATVRLFDLKDQQEIYGKTTGQFQKYPFTENELQKITSSIEKTGIWSGEVEYISKQGREFIAELTISSLQTSNEKYRLIRLFEVFGKKKIEKVFKQQERFLRKVIDTDPNIIFVKSIDGKYKLVNKTFLTAYEISEEDIIDKKDTELNSDVKEAKKLIRADKIVIGSGESVSGEFCINNKKNIGKRCFEFIEVPLFLNNEDSNRPSHILGVASDITERQAIERSLRESEEKFRTLFSSANDSIFIMDGNTFKECNEKTLEMFRCTREDIIGKSPFKFSPVTQPDGQNSRKKGLKQIQAALKGEKSLFYWKHKRLDGSHFDAEVSLNLFDYAGKKCLQAIVRDITERIRFEKALKENEKSFKSLVENYPDGIVIFTDGKCEYANPAFKKLTGIKDWRKLKMHNILDYALPEYHDKLRQRLMKLKNGEDLPLLEMKARTEDGRIIELASRANHVQFRGKKSIQYLLHDLTYRRQLEKEQKRADIAEKTNLKLQKEISEHKKTQKKLKENQKFTKSIIGSSLDMIRATDRRGMITEFNKAAEQTFGYKRNEILNKYVKVLYASEKEFQKVWRSIKDKGSFQGEVVNKKKDGETFISYLTASNLYDDKGKVIGISAISRDITEIKKAEEELRSSEKRYRAIYNQAYIGIAILDTEGKFIQVNQRLCDILGYSPDELCNMSSKDISYPEDHATTLKRREALLKGKIDRYTTEKRYLHKDGSIIFANLTVSVVSDAYGNPQYFIGVYEDITNRKQNEQELSDSLLEKEALIKEIHHRVKNNLQVISSILNLQSSYVKDEQTLELLKESQNRIKSMAFIHESLYQTQDLSHIDFQEYLMSLSKNLLLSYGVYDDSIELIFDIEKVFLNLDLAIPCGLIVNELVSNSLKYAFPSGEGKIGLTVKSNNNAIKLVVEDDGIGIPVNLDYKNTDSLGLQLVNALVDQINGSIRLYRKDGTKFIINIRK